MGAIRTAVERGVTLIELLTVIAVIGLVIFLALPNYRVWIQNTQVRNATEAIFNGVQLARGEAVRRNDMVQFILGPGTQWTVGCQTAVADGDGDGVDDCPAAIQARTEEEGGTTTVALTLLPGGATTVTFNGLGRVVANVDGSPSISEVRVDSQNLSAADSRDLRVTISVGGSIKMCDPNVAAPDPRTCG